MTNVPMAHRGCSRVKKPRGVWRLGSCLALLTAAACGAGEMDPPDSPPGTRPKTAACAGLTTALPMTVPDAADRVTTEPADPIAPLYDQAVLRTFELKLSERDLAILDADPTAEKYVPGTLVFEGKEYGPVGIRYKGSIGGWIFCVANSTPENPTNVGGAKTCPKLSMKISFNEYDSKGRFFGVKKLMFHAMNNDSSLMRERLGYWLYRKMGIPAPRAVHVRLLINGKYQGVFLNVESLDDRFTKSHFNDKDGNLYKEIWPTSIEGFTAPLTPERWKSGLETNADKNPSFDKALAFGRAVMQGDGDARARALQNGMSIANIARYIAVDRAIGHDDGPSHFYCIDGRCLNHNFYLYEEEKASRFWLIPWDLDSSFVVSGSLADEGDAAQRIVKAWNDHSAVCEIGPGASPYAVQQLPTACDPLWNALGCYFQDEHRAAVAELLAGPFSESSVEEKLTPWRAQIASAVDEAFAADARQLPPQEWAKGLTDLRARIEFLRSRAASQR